MGLEETIKEASKKLGFSFCGIAKAEQLEQLRPFYSGFIAKDGHAGFNYLKNHVEKRLNPELVFGGTKSVIALMMNYYPAEIIPPEDNFIISKYAYGKDYHPIMRDRMNLLVSFLQSQTSDFQAKSFVDSGPVPEKFWAQRCGVGWQGKNTLIINKSAGSFFFIGIIFTNIALKPDVAESDHCGDCRRCIDACPTGALHEPYQLDIRKCISYYTIEKKEPLPQELAKNLNDRIFGCDICQDVCPYNRFSKPNSEPGFTPSAGLPEMKKNDWINLTEETFHRMFSGTPIERTGYEQFMRNIQKCEI
jgi:epoxyqueuosine reductase